MISVVVKEIFVMPPVETVLINDFNALVRYAFLNIEFICFCAQIVSNFLFLCMRALTPNQVSIIKVDKRRRMASTDTLEANAILLAQYSGFIIPFIGSFVFLKTTDYPGRPFETIENMYVFYVAQGVQCLLLNFLIFVSWKKGPAWWLAIAPKLFLGMSVFVYLVIPCGLSFYTHSNWQAI